MFRLGVVQTEKEHAAPLVEIIGDYVSDPTRILPYALMQPITTLSAGEESGGW